MISGWLRPFARDFWRLSPDWRQAHKFMSTQAVAAGALAFTFADALGAPDWIIRVIMYATVAMVLAGVVIKQPELED